MKDENITAVRHRSKIREWSEHEMMSNSLYLSMTKDIGEEWGDPSVGDIMSFRDIFRSKTYARIQSSLEVYYPYHPKRQAFGTKW
jgi:hypothetical protein